VVIRSSGTFYRVIDSGVRPELSLGGTSTEEEEEEEEG